MSYIGVIRYLQENGLHHGVREVSGTSAGAMFACLFAMGVLAGELEDFFKQFLQQEENISFPVMGALLSLMDTYGMDSGERLVLPIRYFVSRRYGLTEDRLSFRDFGKRTGVNMVICASGVNRREPMYFGMDTTPDTSIYDAIRASMSIPIFMEPVRIDDGLYIDGGVCDNTPVMCFHRARHHRMLVITIYQDVPDDTKPDSFMNYLSIIAQMVMDNTKNRLVLDQMCSGHDVLSLDNPPIAFMPMAAYDDGTMRLMVTEDDIDRAVAYGYTQTYMFLRDRHRDGGDNPQDAREDAHAVLDVAPVLRGDGLVVHRAAGAVDVADVAHDGEEEHGKQPEDDQVP
jgi:predicted acylesterase/phospholipase RssA